jgi:pimeloyl-ACP methyl ester carboxylesterase/uncharacterized protein YndB with AHSA1/START domain
MRNERLSPARHARLATTMFVAALVVTAASSLTAATSSREGTAVSRDGVRIHYLADGFGPTALVLIHGWSCDATYWDNQVAPLAATYRVIRVDLAGHGSSGQERVAYTPAAFGEDVRAVIEAEKLERVVLVGHSMGGDVALEAARLLAGRVLAIVAIDTLQNAEESLPKEQLDRFLASMDKDFKGFAESFVRAMFPPGADPALVTRIAADMASAPPQVGKSAFRELMSYDEKAGLRNALVPIVCINGTMWPTSAQTNRKYAASFRLVTETGTGHFPMQEKPAEFNRLLLGVLGDLLGSPASEGRRIVKEVEVRASRAEVWRVWTSTTGVMEFFAPLASVDPRPGGEYEMYFGPSEPVGQRGGEGCKVLSLLPEEMLSFEWSFPPSIPALRESGARTWVVVQLADAGPGVTRVKLTQLGWQDGPEWDKGFAYFDAAWGKVLTWLQQRFATGAPEWKKR